MIEAIETESERLRGFFIFNPTEQYPLPLVLFLPSLNLLVYKISDKNSFIAESLKDQLFMIKNESIF